MSKEAMKLALEALELCNGAQTAEGVVVYTDKEITALREEMAEQPAQQVVDCHATGVCVQSGLRAEQPAQQEFVSPGGGYVPAIPVQQALDKMAENARELGLDYEPAPGYCKQCKQYTIEDPLPAQQQSCYCPNCEALSKELAAQRTWVGLTDEDIDQCLRVSDGSMGRLLSTIEAKLKEKNT